MTWKRIKVITSYAGHARYLSELEEEIAGYIPTPRDIPSPYTYSASTPVFRHASGKLIFFKETSHKRYEVFELTILHLMTEEDATQQYLASLRAVIRPAMRGYNSL